MTNLKITIGKQIRFQRKLKGWSQEELADRCNFHLSYIGQVERGEKNITIESLEKILNKLDLPLSVFFKTIDKRNNDLDLAQLKKEISNLTENVGFKEAEIILQILSVIVKKND